MEQRSYSSQLFIIIGVFMLLLGILPLHDTSSTNNKQNVWEQLVQDGSEFEDDDRSNLDLDLFAHHTIAAELSNTLPFHQTSDIRPNDGAESTHIARYLLFCSLKLSFC